MVAPVLLALLTLPTMQTKAGAEARPAPDASVARLPIRVARDFTRLATRTPVFVLAAGGAAAAVARPGDSAAVRALANSPAADRALEAGAIAGDGYVQGGGAAAVYLIGLAAHSPRTQEVGTALLEAQVVEGAITASLKRIVRRTRPNGGHYSFPSGHTSAAFATADVVMQRFGWKAGVPAYAGAAYIAAARLAEREHYLSDVLFGAAVGIASARTVQIHAHGRTLVVVPRPLPGGVVLAVVAKTGTVPVCTFSKRGLSPFALFQNGDCPRFHPCRESQ